MKIKDEQQAKKVAAAEKRENEYKQHVFNQFSTRYDSETSSIWCWLQPEPRPCLNISLIDELIQLQQQLVSTYKNQHPDTIWPFKHLVIASKTPGVFNLGGDLELFRECIIDQDFMRLRSYAYKCIKSLHSNIGNLDLPITTLALVQGQALGGGFETALSCDVIIAERSSKMGFPEILFNLFPGMGAYNLLSRRIGPALAERLILSGRTYTASELHVMGLVDVLAEDGGGPLAVENYMKSHNQSHSTIRSIKKIRQMVHPITQKSLYEIVDVWVEAAMNLSKKDLAKMERLLHLQKHMKNSETIKQQNNLFVQRRSDWRKVDSVNFPLTTHLGENVLHDRRQNDGRRQQH